MFILTGGIGCGKSVVSQVLRVMGYTVYDCDSEARRLMHSDPDLRAALCGAFGQEVYGADGRLNKRYLSDIIFADPEQLKRVNALVHPAVAADVLRAERELKAVQDGPLFVETAIYYEAGFGSLITPEQVWCVAAPLELRIARAMWRDHAPREAILARIDSQLAQEEKVARADAVIWNDAQHSVIEQVNELIATNGL
ncbi:MAG: dephospho-CoA kinase [Bacteroidales bacterium]|nr:dephospho-CoA kinase [Bacteroidales bacterium]